jgi:Na+-driven multidrug efflux pump
LFVIADLISQINLIFVGKHDNIEMIAGYGLAKTGIEMLPVTITLGFAGALETLVSQSYG